MATVVELGCTIGGRLDTDGHVDIFGRVEGSVYARSVHIHGEAVVIAEVAATERIDVDRGARIVGDLRAPVIELAAGTKIDGRVDRGEKPAPGTPSGPAEAHEFSEAKTVRLVTRPPPRRPTRPPPQPPRAAPPVPRPAGRAKLVTRRPGKPEDPR